jgi:hypothetical protein
MVLLGRFRSGRLPSGDPTVRLLTILPAPAAVVVRVTSGVVAPAVSGARAV